MKQMIMTEFIVLSKHMRSSSLANALDIETSKKVNMTLTSVGMMKAPKWSDRRTPNPSTDHPESPIIQSLGHFSPSLFHLLFRASL